MKLYPRRVSNVMFTDRPEKEFHDWQMPYEPIRKWIEAATEPGDLVVDPFTGSGTVALACWQTGRRFVGAEINAKTVDIAWGRLAEAGYPGSARTTPARGAAERGKSANDAGRRISPSTRVAR